MAPFWHRWSYFSIINLSVFHLADKCFTITNLINLQIILFLEYRKTPETLRFRGFLHLDTTLSCDNKSIVYAPISRLRRSFAGIRKMPTSKAIKKETCKQACSLFFYRLDWRFIHCFRVYYSMIVATRPDPTVRPPSRYQTGVLRCANDDFSCDLWGKVRIFHCIRVVFGDFVIMVLSLTYLL